MIKNLVYIFFTLILTTSMLFSNETHNRFLGKEDAPITMYEFASINCVHCATFSETVFPKIKEKYIDTGIVKLIFIDVPFGSEVNLYAHSVLYQTKINEDFFKLLSVFLRNQSKLRTINDVKIYAKLIGISEKDLEKAENKEFQNKLLENSKHYLESTGVEGTPTLFIIKSGEPLTKSSVKLVGTPNFSAVEREVDRLLKK